MCVNVVCDKRNSFKSRPIKDYLLAWFECWQKGKYTSAVDHRKLCTDHCGCGWKDVWFLLEITVNSYVDVDCY